MVAFHCLGRLYYDWALHYYGLDARMLNQAPYFWDKILISGLLENLGDLSLSMLGNLSDSGLSKSRLTVGGKKSGS